MAEIPRNKLKKALIDLIKGDEEFRLIIKGVLAESFATKDEIKAILEEIRNLREDFNKRMEEMREDFNKRMEAFERRMESFEKRMEEMREDFNKRMEAFDLKLSAIGARWGVYNEEAIRNALRGILEKFFKAKVAKWEFLDEDGIVYGYPSLIEADVLIKDGRHILVEIKSHVRKSDVAELLRISEVYEKAEGVKPDLAIVTPFIDRKALEFAKLKKVEVYTTEQLFQ